MHTVAALAYDGVANFELAVPGEVFGIDRPGLGPLYRFLVCAADPPPLRTSAGFAIETPYDLGDLAAADTVVVPSWDPDREPSAEIITALRDFDKKQRLDLQ